MILIRQRSTKSGTPGTLILKDWRSYRTIELPWRNNERRVSCIPAGGPYLLRVRQPWESERFDYPHILVMDVPGREAILFHGANWARQLLGCTAPGLTAAMDGEIPGVSSSRAAVRKIVKAVAAGDDDLYITWADLRDADDLFWRASQR